MAMYLLVWSPCHGSWSTWPCQQGLSDQHQARYQHELSLVRGFAENLGRSGQRPPALPDDLRRPRHHRRLEPVGTMGATATATRFHGGSSAMPCSAICCARPGAMPGHLQATARPVPGTTGDNQDAVIGELLRFQGWQFSLPTEPPLAVLDTRTRRWRSSEPGQAIRPAGLGSVE